MEKKCVKLWAKSWEFFRPSKKRQMGEKIFLAFDNEKGLFISENENGNDVVIGKIRGKFKTFGNEYMVEGEI